METTPSPANDYSETSLPCNLQDVTDYWIPCYLMKLLLNADDPAYSPVINQTILDFPPDTLLTHQRQWEVAFLLGLSFDE